MAEHSSIQWTDSTGRALGALKSAAKRLGLTFADYGARIRAGLRHCTACKDWHRAAAFGVDRSRGDGLAASCLASKRVVERKPRRGTTGRRGWQVATRDGDKRQARRRINYLVEQGRIPHPDDIPCMDCCDEIFVTQHRHEYDHARGYDGENQLYVEAVCSRCHRLREEACRGAN